MIRKAVIVVLTLGAVASFLTGLASLAKPVAMTAYSDKHKLEYLGFRAEDGFAVLIWSRTSTEACRSATRRIFDWQPVVYFGYVVQPWGRLLEVINVSDEPLKTQHWDFDSLGLAPRVGTRTLYYLGANSALLFVLFATYPTIAFIRGPLRRWRRRRRGLCVNCAYDLTGNVTGVCSECGTPV